MTDLDTKLLTLIKPRREYTVDDITTRAKSMLKMRVPPDEVMTAMSRLMTAGMIVNDRAKGLTTYRRAR